MGEIMIERMGFDTLTAKNGMECLEIFNEKKDDIVCVLLDMTMPKMDGVKTYSELTKIREDVVVLVASGYTVKDIEGRFGSKKPPGFIQKPYEKAIFVKKFKQMLGE